MIPIVDAVGFYLTIIALIICMTIINIRKRGR